MEPLNDYFVVRLSVTAVFRRNGKRYYVNINNEYEGLLSLEIVKNLNFYVNAVKSYGQLCYSQTPLAEK